MTLSTTDNKVSYAGDGATASFAIPFMFLENGHIEAVLRDVSGGETVWTLNTEYTLSGAGSAAGGTLTVAAAPVDHTPAAGETLVIRRIAPETQETDYPEGGAFPAAAHEQALDKLTMLIQQHSEQIARSLLLPVSSSLSGIRVPEPGAGELIRWDAAGAALETVAVGDLSLAVDTVLTGLASDDFLQFDGAAWVNRTPADVLASIGALAAAGVLARTAACSLGAADDRTTVFADATAGPFAVTLPPGGTIDPGFGVGIMKIDATANVVTVEGGGDPVNGASSLRLGYRYESLRLRWDGAAWYAVGGRAPAGCQALADGAAIDWDVEAFPVAEVTLGGDRTMNAPAGVREGGIYVLLLRQDATGGRTLTWDAGAFDFGAAGPPALSTDPGLFDIATFIHCGGKMRAAGLQKGYI